MGIAETHRKEHLILLPQHTHSKLRHSALPVTPLVTK
jgi:hypothetical protein